MPTGIRIGTHGDDTLAGSVVASNPPDEPITHVVLGLAGDDLIFGTQDSDTLLGGRGDDTITGNAAFGSGISAGGMMPSASMTARTCCWAGQGTTPSMVPAATTP